jgi:hypothetical protein
MRLSSISSLSIIAPSPSLPRSGGAFALPQDTPAASGTKASAPRAVDASAPPMPSDKLRDALTAFEKEARMTPAERARRDILEDMELTEDALKAMPAEKRNVIEDAIAKEVAKRLALARTLATSHAG